MYEPGKVLIVGGKDPPRATAEKIDLNLPTPAWQLAGNMASARRQFNATVLPDGTVLVTGGSSAAFSARPVVPSTRPLWDPAQPVENAFTTLASATRYRGYHSIALLSDGRVLSSGGDNEPNAEVFFPPYLFKGSRPAVTSVPSEISYGNSFFVQTPDATSITAVTLVRLSAVTHAFTMNQRLVRLAFSSATGGLAMTAPAAGEIAPPGHYHAVFAEHRWRAVDRTDRQAKQQRRPAAGGADEPQRLGCLDQPDQSLVDRHRAQRNWFPNRVVFRWKLIHGDQHRGGERHDVRRHRLERVDPVLVSRTRLRTIRLQQLAERDDLGVTAICPPSAPTGLSATRQAGRFTLAWTDTSNTETGFAIQRSPHGQTFSQRDGDREHRDVRGHESWLLEVRVLPRLRVQRVGIGWLNGEQRGFLLTP